MKFIKSIDRNNFYIGIIAFLIVLFSRVCHIYLYGVDVPWADSWDGEIEKLYFKYLDETISINDIFSQANEHYIIFTKLMNLVLFILNGNEFNQKFVMSMNSIFLALTAAILVYWMNSNRKNYIFSILIILIFSVVLDWENLYWSYQSQVYFALFFAVIGLVIISKNDYNLIFFSIIVFLAGNANASAVYLPIIALFSSIFYSNKLNYFRSFYFLLLSIFSYKLFVAPTPWHDIYKATSIEEILQSSINYTNFPMYFGTLLWLLSLVFIIYLSIESYYKKTFVINQSLNNTKYGLLLLSWFFLFLLSSIYNRAGFENIPPRYFDYYLIGLIGILFIISDFKIIFQSRIIKILILIVYLIILLPQTFKAYDDWKSYSQTKQAYRDIIKKELITINNYYINGLSYEQILVLVKSDLSKYPLPFAGYPNYDIPSKILANKNSLIIFGGYKIGEDNEKK